MAAQSYCAAPRGEGILLGMSEREISMDAIRARLALIPSVQTFGYRLEELAPGRAVIVAPYERKYDGVFDCFHGGLLATLADSTAGSAVLTVCGVEARTATTDFNIRFLAPCRTDARAVATVVSHGKSLVLCSVEVTDAAGKVVALAQVNYMKLGRRLDH